MNSFLATRNPVPFSAKSSGDGTCSFTKMPVSESSEWINVPSAIFNHCMVRMFDKDNRTKHFYKKPVFVSARKLSGNGYIDAFDIETNSIIKKPFSDGDYEVWKESGITDVINEASFNNDFIAKSLFDDRFIIKDLWPRENNDLNIV